MIYVNKKNLVSIEETILQDIKFDLIVDTKSLKSYYVEWLFLWLDAIISLRMSKIKIGC